jgi:predicted transcriptional regulator
MFVKVEDSTFIRDTSSGALINQDLSSRDEYIAKVRMINEHKSDINTINNEINSLKTDISEIKSLLSILINKS